MLFKWLAGEIPSTIVQLPGIASYKETFVLFISTNTRLFSGRRDRYQMCIRDRDITRTIALGEPTEQMKKDFTRVLKGTISLAKSKFPAGTRGSQIDILARKALWDSGINYLHGTGHGIGHCLNVHEGPQSIRMEENPVTLKPGMVISDEPAMRCV